MGCVKGRPGAAPAGRDDRRLYQWEDFTEERQEADLPPDVAARLGPLGHDQIAARLLGRHGLGTRTDLPGDEGAASVRDLHEFRVRLLVEELDHRGPGGRHLQNLQEVGVELAGLAHPVNDEVRAERAGRRPTQAVEDLRDVLRRRGSDSADHPEASGVRDRRRQGRRGDFAHPRLLQRHRAPEQFREFRLEHRDPPQDANGLEPFSDVDCSLPNAVPCRGRPRGEPRPLRSRLAPIVLLTGEFTFANLWASYMYNYPYNILL